MTRWHHGHSTLVGVLLGLTLSAHAWLLVGLGLVLGLSVTRLRRAASAVVAWVTAWRRPAQGAGRPPLRGLK